ncbi:hypothetical protein M1N21_03585, partial [Dehalococcoidia bacterium]|nr:hypothetical protein [Dehalococcoidia bacterium]
FGSTSYIYPEIKAKLESIWREVKDEQSIKTKTDNWASIIRTLYGHKPDVSMLIDHTYFNILTKVIVYLKFADNKPDRIEIPEVINGKYFIDKGITNFLEEDFSLWLLCPQIEDKSFVIFDTIMDALTNYDFFRNR